MAGLQRNSKEIPSFRKTALTTPGHARRKHSWKFPSVSVRPTSLKMMEALVADVGRVQRVTKEACHVESDA